MPAPGTKKFAPEIDAALYEEFVAAAKKNGQSQRYVLEQALAYYLRHVVPSQHLVRPPEWMRLRNPRPTIAICWSGSPSRWRIT